VCVTSKGCFATTKSKGHSLPQNQRQEGHINRGVQANVSFASWLGMKRSASLRQPFEKLAEI